MGSGQAPRLGTHGCTPPVAGPLLSPYYAWRHAVELYGAPALHVSYGQRPPLVPAYVFIPECSGSLLFFFVSRQFEMHVPQC